NVPQIGDADDGVLVRLDPARDFDPFRSLLATGAVLFERADLRLKAGKLDDKSRWLLGDAAESKFRALAASTEAATLPVRCQFPQGGYYILGSDFETRDEVRIVADAGPLGYLSIAAHGHADALSFTLSAGGLPILVDPGTYAYHTDRQWRGYFFRPPPPNPLRRRRAGQTIPAGKFPLSAHPPPP